MVEKTHSVSSLGAIYLVKKGLLDNLRSATDVADDLMTYLQAN
jgi:hypothetical protein